MSQVERSARPENVTVEDLRHYLTEVEGKTATQRIMVGINHKEGIPQTQLADWYDVSRTTIHNWLNRLERLEDEPLETVIYDEQRPGRPSKLDEGEREQLVAVLDASPSTAGYDDAETWTPQLVQTYIEDVFDVEYSLSYVRELMHEHGVIWRSVDHADASGVTQPEQPDPADGHDGSEDDPAPQRVHGCRS